MLSLSLRAHDSFLSLEGGKSEAADNGAGYADPKMAWSVATAEVPVTFRFFFIATV